MKYSAIVIADSKELAIEEIYAARIGKVLGITSRRSITDIEVEPFTLEGKVTIVAESHTYY